MNTPYKNAGSAWNQPPAAGQAAHTPALVEFIAEIDRLIDAQKPSTHLWNYCVWNRKDVLRAAVRHDMSIRKVLAHHELMPGRVAANTETLLADLLACNSHTALSRAWSELAFHANALANAKGKPERDAAALKVFCAIGDAKDALPELRTLAESRAALQAAQS